jgi:acetyl esterase/lipase
VEFIDRVDPEVRKVLDGLPPRVLDFSLGIDVVRKAYTEMQQAIAMPEVPNVSFRDIAVPGYADGDADVVVRIYEPDARTTDAVIYWIHGGGMVLGHYDGDAYMNKLWASRFGAVVLSVEYRLAPEHPYPAPLQDCYAGLRWLHRNAAELGVNPARIVVAGGSAGGGLAAGTCLLARDLGEVAPSAQILFFPMIDDRDATPSNIEVTYPQFWSRDKNQYGWASYLAGRAGADDIDIYAAPARATAEHLRGLPPTSIDVGELDAFRDEDIEYAQKLLQAGVPTELLVTPGAFHASENYNPAAASSKRINRFRNEAFARATAPAS